MPKKILIVDDDPGDILFLKKVLGKRYSLIETSNAGRAIDIACSEHPDLVVSDVMMPRVSGYTLCGVLKSNPNTKDIPIILVTGLDAKMNEEIVGVMGADGYLTKPVQKDRLLNMISGLLTIDK